MKFWAGVALGIGLMVMATVCPGCAHGPNPCVGKTSDQLPCWCPATTALGCEPWIADTKRPHAGQGVDR